MKELLVEFNLFWFMHLLISESYILEFTEEITPSIFQKTFHGKRLYDTKLSVTVTEGKYLVCLYLY